MSVLHGIVQECEWRCAARQETTSTAFPPPFRDPRLFDLEKFKKISELKEAKDDENIKVFLGLRDALQSPKSAKSI
jgi:hypothetical protein